MKEGTSSLLVLLIALGTLAAAAGNWWLAVGLWVFVVADRLDEISCAVRSAHGDGEED